MKLPAKLVTARGGFPAGALVKYKGASTVIPPVDTGSGSGGTTPSPITGTNLLSDTFGTFEGSDLSIYTSGPAQGNGAVASFDTSWTASGSKSLRITAAAGASFNAGLVWPVSVGVTAGQYVRITGTLRRGAGTTNAQAGIRWLDSAGNALSEPKAASVPASAGGVIAFDNTLTAPANTVGAQIVVRYTTNAPTTGDYFQIDNLQAATVTLNPFDGLPGGTVAPRATTGTYAIAGTKLTKDGTPFKMVGANMGVNAAIGGNYTSDESVNAHTAEAVQWGWNTVRMHVYVSTITSWIASYTRARAISDIFAATDKYLAAGFIVIHAVMDQTSGLQQESEQAKLDFEDFFAQSATRYKTDSRVWFNVNEPSNVYNVSTFMTLQSRMYNAVRNTGNTSIYIADILTNAQDGVYANQPKAWDPLMGPAFLTNSGGTARTNVLFGLHNYGGQCQNADSQATFNATYNTWAQQMHDAGLAYFTGETGYKQNGLDQAGNATDYNRNNRGFYAALQQQYSNGVCVWDATFDQFTLKSEMQTQYHGQPFWYQGAGTALSQMGLDFWNWGHAYTAPSWT